MSERGLDIGCSGGGQKIKSQKAKIKNQKFRAEPKNGARRRHDIFDFWFLPFDF
jgi:hypothetical protein